MAELREFLQVIPGAEVHLVLSTTTHPRTLRSVAERFSAVGFHRLILTKLDETASFGALLGALVAVGKPVSFLTDGQNVPEDLMPSDPDRLADLVLKALGFDPEDLPRLFGAAELGVTRWGTLRTDGKTMMTNIDGVFAAGDIVRGASLVVWGIRDGRDVAQHMHQWMRAQPAREAAK